LILTSNKQINSEFLKMKVIGFTGSPRNGSNTEIIVEEILKGAVDAGAETEIFNLSKMDIAACKACQFCKENEGKCATQDDMQIAYKKIQEADALVLGSPVYMWQMSAQTKLFTDRLYATFMTGFQEKYGKKDMLLVFSQGNPDENIFKEYFNYTRSMFDFLGYNVKDLLSSNENRMPGVVKNKKNIMGKAREIGRSLIEG
jgi:multimeric flavodoxin WrbA